MIKVKSLCLNCHLERWRLTCTLVCPLKRNNYWQTCTTKGLHQRKCFSKKACHFGFSVDFFYFGGGVGVSGHHFPYLLFTSIINPHLLNLHWIFFIGGRSWERVFLLPSLLTSYYLVFFHLSHTDPPPPTHTTPLIFLRGNLGNILEFVSNAFWKEFNWKNFWKFIDNLYKE